MNITGYESSRDHSNKQHISTCDVQLVKYNEKFVNRISSHNRDN